MRSLYSVIGDRAVRHLIMPGSHDAGMSQISNAILYDDEGGTQGQRISHIGNDEYYARVASEVVRLLSAHSDRGLAYRVDLRLRPEGQRHRA